MTLYFYDFVLLLKRGISLNLDFVLLSTKIYDVNLIIVILTVQTQLNFHFRSEKKRKITAISCICRK